MKNLNKLSAIFTICKSAIIVFIFILSLTSCKGKEANSFTIPDSVTRIGYAAFAYCSNLTSITIPDSVNSILKNAFNICINLTRVTFESSNIWNFGEKAFNGDFKTKLFENDWDVIPGIYTTKSPVNNSSIWERL
jgi:hypothetical protein